MCPSPGEKKSRVGVIGIIVTDREQQAERVNEILGEFGDVIVGRMGIPYRERNISVIALIVDGDTDTLGALTGRLGSIPGVRVKSALVSTG
ncbi:TM1266 family iron-only hydrogenase system putative regulator [Candidatus Caldatribacterium sp. SIUC1]|uniref:TM1266 family iron-only hydrogenase system putative regulator n=1 Tax=Candidatus Caldatribacterium sp. SIUC1 TaxID=3418365 RepID=UPI003F68C37F